MEITDKPLVALAGASGFVGTHLRMRLEAQFRFRALTRSHNVAEQRDSGQATQWQHCDLYSLPRLTEALRGCTLGIYLVHSMAPSCRLMQANFEDTDLLLADNFIRAAEAAGLKHVVYLSGLLPQGDEPLSPHLRSRAEVEAVLKSRSVQVTVLRAGLIFGPGGSSFSMLTNLVRRLPYMILPAWASSMTQSVDIENICDAFEECLCQPQWTGGTYDLGGHEPMSYGAMICRTGEWMGRSIRTISLPWHFFALSRRWVSYFGRVPVALVRPLQESLLHDLRAAPNPLLEHLKPRLIGFEDSLARAVDPDGRPLPNPRSRTQSADQQHIRQARRVRSVQRMALPAGWSAGQVAREYGIWLSSRYRGLLKVDTDSAGVVRFSLLSRRIVLLELTPSPFSEDERRCAFYISGGLLSRTVDPPGRLEFRTFAQRGCLIASIHGFVPTLPWWLYVNTQARAHLLVMRAFGRYLSRVS
jgi:uncharacterized protein YbjT (DUF2867 family)